MVVTQHLTSLLMIVKVIKGMDLLQTEGMSVMHMASAKPLDTRGHLMTRRYWNNTKKLPQDVAPELSNSWMKRRSWMR